MKSQDYDDPTLEEQWCNERRAQVEEYLKRERVTHGRIGEWPAWHVTPYVSIWAIESAKSPDMVGWWVICGDLPTDYVSSKKIKHPRDALRAIAEEWLEISDYMRRGEEHPTSNIGTRKSWYELEPLLKSRAEQLLRWAKDNTLWGE